MASTKPAKHAHAEGQPGRGSFEGLVRDTAACSSGTATNLTVELKASIMGRVSSKCKDEVERHGAAGAGLRCLCQRRQGAAKRASAGIGGDEHTGPLDHYQRPKGLGEDAHKDVYRLS